MNEVQASLRELVALALAEDVGDGDWTTLWTVDETARTRAVIVAKEELVVSGVEAALEVFRQVDPELRIECVLGEGAEAGREKAVLRLEGSSRSILTAERTALNFLGRLSGIATLTRRFVNAVEGTGTRIIDTRKTTPGLRTLEKAAVRAGGGTNHRMGLYDMVLIKDNHIAASGGVGAAARRAAAGNRRGLPVEVEVFRPEQVEELRGITVDRILLDNMSLEALSESVERVRKWPEPRPQLEASGNMSLDRVRSVAETGVDFISVGALTHSALVADLSLRFNRPGR